MLGSKGEILYKGLYNAGLKCYSFNLIFALPF